MKEKGTCPITGLPLKVRVKNYEVDNPRMVIVTRFSPWWLWRWKFATLHNMWRWRMRLEANPRFTPVANIKYSVRLVQRGEITRWDMTSIDLDT